MARFLGVDGGGTRTRYVVVDDGGHLIGAAEGGSINVDDHPLDLVKESLRRALAELHGSDAIEPFDAAFFALGGVLSRKDRAVVRSVVCDVAVAPPERLGVHHDAYGALEGGLLGAPGLIVVAGTGSICFGRDADGREAKCGNWGPLFGDDGSGHWLGREALRAVAHAHDGRGAPTALTGAVREWLDLQDLDDLLHRLYVDGLSRAEIAAFAPTVLALARDGDQVASAVLERGCTDLARCVAVVHAQLFHEAWAPVFVIGGLGKDPTYMQEFRRQVGMRAPEAEFVEAVLPPVLGAARLAMKVGRASLNDRVDATLKRAIKALPESF